MKSIILAVCIVFVSVGYGQAESDIEGYYKYGNDLLELAKSWEKTTENPEKANSVTLMKSSIYVGYVNGILEFIMLMNSRSESNFINIPSQSSYHQMYKIINKYLRDHPEKLHKRSILLVVMSLQKAFPPQSKESN
jgi:hypothetical protein